MNTSHFHVANVSFTKISKADTKLLGMEENFNKKVPLAQYSDLICRKKLFLINVF